MYYLYLFKCACIINWETKSKVHIILCVKKKNEWWRKGVWEEDLCIAFYRFMRRSKGQNVPVPGTFSNQESKERLNSRLVLSFPFHWWQPMGDEISPPPLSSSQSYVSFHFSFLCCLQYNEGPSLFHLPCFHPTFFFFTGNKFKKNERIT